MMFYYNYCRIGWLWLTLLVMLTYCQNAEESLEYDLSEERPPGTFVGNVVIDAHMNGPWTSDDISKMKFSFLRQREPHWDNFRIEETTGVIRTTRRIDRDIICSRQLLCQVDLNVMVQPSSYFQIIKVTVTILDLNDNSPQFPEARMVLYVPEGATVGSVFAVQSAEDVDSGKFGIQSYKLLSASKKFSLQVTNNSAESIDVLLHLNEKVDREVQEFYTMEVVATDGGTPSRSGSMMVDITIVDSNDNNPVFANSTYNITVPENVALNAVLLRVHATDPDVGLNGEIVYSFSSHTKEQYGDLFSIDNATGQIQARGQIDYEATSIYYLTVMAQDRGPNSMPAYTKVVLNVEDINDYTPEITVNALTASRTVQVSESASPGTFVAHVSVVDKDAGRNGQVRCTIESDLFELKKLFPTEYKVVTSTAARFDRETQSEYQVDVICRDKGKPSLRATSQIDIFVRDENDHSPVFDQSIYHSVIRENNMVGAFVVQVNASDQDEGDNAMIRYSLRQRDDRNLLVIDTVSGVVAANAIFDYEKKKNYEFLVLAYDNGRPRRTSTATISLSVGDVNDESPHFLLPTYRFEVEENQSAGSFVGLVSAVDADTYEYNVVTYAIDVKESGTRAFAVHPDTGRIVTTRELDREEQEVYKLVLIASNMGHPQMRNTVDVSVYVLDHNDNIPVITFPNDYNNTIDVAYTTPVGHIVTQILAHDPDLNNNAALKYRIAGGDDEGIFNLDEVTGIMTVKQDISEQKGRRFSMVTMVTDGGTPHKSSVATIHIHIKKKVLVPQRRTATFLGLSGNVLIFSVVSLFLVVVVILVLLVAIVRCRQRQIHRNRKHNCRAPNKTVSGQMDPPNYRESVRTDTPLCANVKNPNWNESVEYSDRPGGNKKAVTFKIEMDDQDTDDRDRLWSENQHQQVSILKS